MFDAIRADVAAMLEDESGLGRWVRAFLFANVRTVIWYRIGHWFATHRMLSIAYLIRFHVLKVSGADINPKATIGPGFILVHPCGVVIGADVWIGRKAWIAHGVTIGCGTKPGQPVLGDRVEVGCGASILGGIVVGDDVKIGSNVVVTHNVPENSIVNHSKQTHVVREANHDG